MTLLFLFVVVFKMTATNLDIQNVTIEVNENDLSLKELITEIERQTDFLVLYRNDDVDINRLVHLKDKSGKVTTMLDEIFIGTDIRYEIQNKYIVLAKNSPSNTISTIYPSVQQTRTITGTVVDETGEPLPGVSIMISGTSRGTVTEADGTFILNQVTSDAILSVSYIGYATQEVAVGNRTNINIQLVDDTKLLEEVVVVGYGTQKKETLSGAVSAIRSEEIVATKTENFISNIQGKVAGLQIRKQTGLPGMFDDLVSIRGYGTPLIIIDGVRRGARNNSDAISELAQLASEDIESVSILKDASAAIYGMNSANGVLLVTTKRGSTDGKARVSYNGRIGYEMPYAWQETVDWYNYMLYANETQRNGGRGLYAAFDIDMIDRYRTNQPGYQDCNIRDLTLKNGEMSQEHNATINGGNSQTQYFVSVGYTRQNGLLKTDVMYYERYNFRSNVTTALSKDLKLNVSVSGRSDKRSDSNEDFWAAMKAIYSSERGKNWHTIANPDHLTYYQPEGKNLKAIFDPDINGYRTYENLQAMAQAELSYTVPFVKGLILSSTVDYNIRHANNSQLYKSYILYDYYTDQPVSTFNSDSYSNTMRMDRTGYLRLMAIYNKKAGNHGLNLMATMEGYRTRYDNLSGYRRYEDLFTNPILDQATASTATNSGSRSFGRLAAYIGRLNYDYAGRFLLEVVGRYDGSYRYSPEKRWAFFPSASIGWRLSEEAFIKDNLIFLSNLKLRASYGKTGRDAGAEFQYIPGYSSSAARGTIFNDGTLTVGMYPPGVVNNEMSWVTSIMSDIGVDFDLYNRKFGGTFDFFHRKNTGMLASPTATVPNFFGASFPQENLNSDMNIGLELSLYHSGKIGKDFTYNVSANATYARQKRIYVEMAPYTSQWARWNARTAPGRYLGASLIYQFDGQYQSLVELETAPLHGGAQGNARMLPGEFRIKDLNGDGVINTSDRMWTNWTYGDEGYSSGDGSTTQVNPPLQYGLTLSGTYKDFSLTMLLQGSALYSVNFAQNDVWGYGGRYPSMITRYEDRWHTLNDTDDPFAPTTQWVPGYYAPLVPYPRSGTTSDNAISVFRPMGNYLRLKNLEVAYTVPRSILSSVGISRLRVFINTTNLFTICSKDLGKIDPEQQEKDYQANLTYPIMKAVNFGLNLTF